MKRCAAILCLVLAGSGCAGPQAPLEIGSKDVAVDIILGASRPPLPLPPPGSNINVGFPGFIEPPLPPLVPGATPQVPSAKCPLADPRDASELVAHQHASVAPVPATYIYRNVGTFQSGSAAPTTFPATETHTVANVKTGTGTYDFDVAVTLAGITTTTTYRVVDQETTPDNGIYIVQIVTAQPSGNEAFTPDRPILLMPLLQPNLGTGAEDTVNQYAPKGYQSSGSDPLTQTSMTLSAQINGKTRVNACGKWIDVYDVEVTTGKIIGPRTKQIDFKGHYSVAPQYGALIASSDLTLSGTDALVALSSHKISTIDELPVTPS